MEDRVSRTQFQYTLEDPNADELNTYAPHMLARLRELPELRDVASDQQVQGLRARLVFDRDTASRLGITPPPSTRPSTMPTASAQVSTIFTQLNQYHVVLEVQAGFQQNPVRPAQSLYPHRRGIRRRRRGSRWQAARLGLHRPPTRHRRHCRIHHATERLVQPCHRVLHRVSQRRPGSAQRLYPRRARSRAHHRQSPGPVPGRHALLQSGARMPRWAMPSTP